MCLAKLMCLNLILASGDNVKTAGFLNITSQTGTNSHSASNSQEKRYELLGSHSFRLVKSSFNISVHQLQEHRMQIYRSTACGSTGALNMDLKEHSMWLYRNTACASIGTYSTWNHRSTACASIGTQHVDTREHSMCIQEKVESTAENSSGSQSLGLRSSCLLLIKNGQVI